MTPTDTEISVYAALTTWQHHHPNHPGIGTLTLHALTGIPGHQLKPALQHLTQAGHITRHPDRWDPHYSRWRPAR